MLFRRKGKPIRCESARDCTLCHWLHSLPTGLCALWYFFLRLMSRAAFCLRRSSKMSKSRYVCASLAGKYPPLLLKCCRLAWWPPPLLPLLLLLRWLLADGERDSLPPDGATVPPLAAVLPPASCCAGVRDGGEAGGAGILKGDSVVTGPSPSPPRGLWQRAQNLSSLVVLEQELGAKEADCRGSRRDALPPPAVVLSSWPDVLPCLLALSRSGVCRPRVFSRVCVACSVW